MTPTPQPHPDVAGYVLGVLDPADTDAFEIHLIDCAACAREAEALGETALRMTALDFSVLDLDALAGTRRDLVGTAAEPQPGLPAPPAPAEHRAVLPDLTPAPVRAEAQRGSSRRRMVWALAAAGAIIAGPLATLAATGRTEPTVTAAPSVSALAGEVHSAKDAATGVQATAGIQEKSWGSAVTVRLSNVTGPERCQLVAVAADGSTRELGDWSVPAAGYGTAQHPEPLTINASTDLPPDQIDQLQVRTRAGRTLATIQV